LSAEELQRLWGDLALGDGRGARSPLALAEAGDRAVRFLAGRLRPEAAVDPEEVRRLLADLDNDEFTTREKATEALQALGERIEPALRKALAAGPPAESRRRLGQILDRLGPERLRRGRAVESLELVGTAAARDLLRELAKGAPDARLTREALASLERLARRS
jgi:hypothetical protein